LLESCNPIALNASGDNAYPVTNKGALNLIELDLLNVSNGSLKKLESDPEQRVDLANAEVSDLCRPRSQPNFRKSPSIPKG
jgi:hypothetical protein